MPLEAIMIAVDNSEYTRNGDYAPTRFLAQNEAVSYLANAKLQDNQESSVGLMSMAGNRIEVLCSPGREPGQLLNALAKDVRIGGTCNFLAALKTAQLALKNRANKNQRQRIIMFVASPIETSVEELVKQAKIAKKNNIAIDVINFGSENAANGNTEKLEQLIAAVDTSDNSHLVSIPPGPHIFADIVLTSSIMSSGGGGGGASVGGVSAAAPGVSHPGGVDPNMDPEMAMVLRMSMEEERARQEKAASTSGAPAPAAAGAAPAAAAGGAAPMEEDEDALLAQAIALSMQQNQDTDMPDASAPAAASTTAATPAAAAAPDAADIDLALQDPDFLNSLLSGVPGADGEQIDNLLDQLTNPNANAEAPKKPEDAKKDEKK